MATPAQIAANRRNARKSTGPKSVSGKLKSSRNSRRHGLNSKLPRGEVLAMYEEIIGRKVVAEGESFDHAALRLAAAEVRLARAQLAERNLLAVGDDGVRMLPDLYMIQEVVMDEIIFQGKASEDTLRQAQRLEERTLRAGARSAHRQYPRMRRYLREAELAHRAALRDWLTQK